MIGPRLAVDGAALADWIDNTHNGHSVAVIARYRALSRGAIYARLYKVGEIADLATWSAILDALAKHRRTVSDVTPAMVLRALGLQSDPGDLAVRLTQIADAVGRGALVGCCPASDLCIAAEKGDVIARAPVAHVLAAVAFGWLKPSVAAPELDHLSQGPRFAAISGAASVPRVQIARAAELIGRGSVSAPHGALLESLSIIGSADTGLRDRIKDTLPPRAARIVVGVALEGATLTSLEASLGLPARSAKVLLADGLDLAERLGLAKIGAVA